MKKVIAIVALLSVMFTHSLMAESKQVLDLQIQETLKLFEIKAKGGKQFLDTKCAGYLVMPNVYKAGFLIGGAYGEGGLIIDNNITEYYKMVSASIGFQAGAQKRSIIIAFITQDALKEFRSKKQWEAGVDGSVSIFNWGGGIDLSTVDFKKTVIAFVFNEQGLMASLSLDGAIFKKIKK